MKTPIFSKKGKKFGSESIQTFLKIFLLSSLKILGASLGRIDVLAGTPRTTQPSCPILKNENIIGRDLPQRWNRSGFSRPDPTGKFQNLRRLTGF